MDGLISASIKLKRQTKAEDQFDGAQLGDYLTSYYPHTSGEECEGSNLGMFVCVSVRARNSI